MNLSDWRLAPVPGADGLVSRTTHAVLFVGARTPVDEVRRLVDLVAGASGPGAARALARDLAAVVAADGDGTLPPFALVATSGAGTYVRVYGAVEVHLMGDDGEEVLTGVGSFTGVDREVAGPFHTISVHPAGAPTPAPVFDVDVQAGTAPGSGFSLTTLTSPTDAPAAAPAPAAEAAPVAAPAPVEPDVPEAPAPDAAPAAVEPDLPGGAPGEAAAVAAMNVGAGGDAPTQAWTPSTADFEADDLTTGAAAAPDDATSEPAWGSAAPDPQAAAEPVAEAPVPEPAGPVLDKAPAEPTPSEAPGTPTPVPGPGVADEPAGAAQPVAWEDLPVADEPAPAAPEPDVMEEPATMAVTPEMAAEVAAQVAASEAPPAAPVAPEPSGFTSQLLGALDDEDDGAEEREPLPVELDPGEVRQADNPSTTEVQVQGVICSRGHFNDPRSRFCSSCGISMVQNTQILTQGPRPPLGVMVFEDGATFSLSSDYVVGRQPEVSDLVQEGLALPLQVDDPERSISRAHAELRLVDWDVHLVNLSGTNGSFVWDENGQQWVPIPEGQSVVLTPGMRVALGRRSAVFESSLVR